MSLILPSSLPSSPLLSPYLDLSSSAPPLDLLSLSLSCSPLTTKRASTQAFGASHNNATATMGATADTPTQANKVSKTEAGASPAGVRPTSSSTAHAQSQNTPPVATLPSTASIAPSSAVAPHHRPAQHTPTHTPQSAHARSRTSLHGGGLGLQLGGPQAPSTAGATAKRLNFTGYAAHGRPPPIPSPGALLALSASASKNATAAASNTPVQPKAPVSSPTAAAAGGVATPKSSAAATLLQAQWLGNMAAVASGVSAGTSGTTTGAGTPVVVVVGVPASSPRLGPAPSPRGSPSSASTKKLFFPSFSSPNALHGSGGRHVRSASASPTLLLAAANAANNAAGCITSPTHAHGGPCGSPSSASLAASVSAAAAVAAGAPTSTADRFIAARRDLASAIARVQARAHDQTYSGGRGLHATSGLGGAAAADKENPHAHQDGEAARITAALNKAEFAQLLAQNLLPSPTSSPTAATATAAAAAAPGLAEQDGGSSMLSFTSPSSSPTGSGSAGMVAPSSAGSAIRRKLAPKALFGCSSTDGSAASASASASAASAAAGGRLNMHTRNFAMDYHQQLSNTYRTPSGSAASVAAAAAAASGSDHHIASVPVQPASSLRTSSRSLSISSSAGLTSTASASPLSPTLDRSLAARASSVARDPLRVLDSPGLVNDYYLNLLHWNSANGVLAIGLGHAIYLWNSNTLAITALNMDGGGEGPQEDMVTSLRWQEDGSTIAVGYASACTKLWDVATASESSRPLQTLRSHSARVSCLDWNHSAAAGASGAGGFMLASGGADSDIHLHDVRQSSGGGRSITASYTTHTEEVCGLAFSNDGTQLASGANDNKLCIWNLRAASSSSSSSSASSSSSPTGHLTLSHHSAAVKALAWCPWQDRLLASGGGLADGHIRFCHAITGAQTLAVDTASQVCSLQFSRNGDQRELLSAHGHPDHTLALWRCPDMTRIATLRGHQSRVLHTGISPDGSTCVSAAADETLRFWKVWKPIVQKKHNNADLFRSSPLHRHIR